LDSLRRRTSNRGEILNRIFPFDGAIGTGSDRVPQSTSARIQRRVDPEGAIWRWLKCAWHCLFRFGVAPQKRRWRAFGGTPPARSDCGHFTARQGVMRGNSPLLAYHLWQRCLQKWRRRSLIFRDAGSPCPSPCGRRALSVRPRFAPAERCGRHAMTAFRRRSTSQVFPDWRGSCRD
jgi:hypothetical protein